MKNKLGLICLFVSNFLGMWLYVFIGSLVGMVDPVWWGGEAWFIPSFGMLVLFVSILPSYLMIKKHLTSSRVQSINNRYFFTIGFFQGVTCLPIAMLVLKCSSIFWNWFQSWIGVSIHGFGEIVFTILNFSLVIFASILGAVSLIALHQFFTRQDK